MFKSNRKVILSLTAVFSWLSLGNEKTAMPWMISTTDCSCSAGHLEAMMTTIAELLSELNWLGTFSLQTLIDK